MICRDSLGTIFQFFSLFYLPNLLLFIPFTEELKILRNLVVTAKENALKVVPALVKKMLEKNIFLFGFLDMNEGAVAETVNQLTELQNARIQVAYREYVFQHMFFTLV